MKNILIIGHGRHGKDTVAELMSAHFGFTFESSSMAAARIFLYDLLKGKYGYQNFEECYADRHNRRAEWYDAICEYNRKDKARLAKDILKDSNIYVGMRDDEECDECLRQGIFDLVIGVFDPRKPKETPTSFKIDMWKKAHLIIPNGSTLGALDSRVRDLEPLLISPGEKAWISRENIANSLAQLDIVISMANKVRYTLKTKTPAYAV